MTHLDLFSGIGGFAIAAQNCGFTTIGFCEREPYAQQILRERFGAVLADAGGSTLTERNNRREEHQPHGRNEIRNQHCTSSSRPKLHDNIFTLNGADYRGVDLLTGGFPCQPFSVAGKRRGKDDDRAIWPQMLRVINEARPAWVIGENVAGIVSMELDNILSDLEGISYAAWPLVIPACAVDARHRRDRVWIIGYAKHARLTTAEISGSLGTGNDDSQTRTQQASEAAGSSEQLPSLANANDMRHKPKLREEVSRRQGSSITNPQSGGGSERRNALLIELQEDRDVADADGASTQGNEPSKRSPQQRTNPDECCQWRVESEWFVESGMGRVAHGIPNRAHRLRGLGNAIVPQVAEEIIRAIALQHL